MAITPYRASNDPFDRLFDTLMGSGSGGYNRGGSLMRAPETDVIETQNEIRVLTEMPGLKRDDIEIDVENNVLTIRGEKREERTEEQEGRYHLAERRYGTFTRSFVLPRDVDPEGIEARFEDGVLNVTIPKSEKARRRRIEVGGGGGGSQEIQTQSQGGGSEGGRSRGGKKSQE
ncbi:MAG TPA: Hsp20/alpha crystallin family protein [Longimicrobiaceae bacterium]|nr:Hsp20/alpha crystallin family protein [Longimicrobiaceae bacterium]